jgi:hypothetical protein
MSLDHQPFLEMGWLLGKLIWCGLMDIVLVGGFVLFYSLIRRKKRVNSARASGAGWLSPAEAHMACLG